MSSRGQAVLTLGCVIISVVVVVVMIVAADTGARRHPYPAPTTATCEER